MILSIKEDGAIREENVMELPDQIVTWGGPIASFRWDNGNSIDIQNLSVREIAPPA